jgi:hypothetical protein
MDLSYGVVAIAAAELPHSLADGMYPVMLLVAPALQCRSQGKISPSVPCWNKRSYLLDSADAYTCANPIVASRLVAL